LPAVKEEARSSVFPLKLPFPEGEMFLIVFLFHDGEGLGLGIGDLFRHKFYLI
jgi:hypothetical protein